MSQVVSLEGWPSTSNCVAWSHENIIAVAVRDRVALSIPNLHSSDKGQASWKTLYLDTGDFTVDELQPCNPEAWSTFSLSEELSERHVISLQWSPPGLGLHGRCALAVLTANDVLSLWACDGIPDAKHNWRRVAIVNDNLSSSASNQDPLKSVDAGVDERRFQRVRSFTWSHLAFERPGQHVRPIERLMPAVLLAICNDAAGIVVFEVGPASDVLHPGFEPWDIRHCASFTVPPSPTAVLTTHLPNSGKNDTRSCIENLSWSAWTFDEAGCLASTLAWSTNSTTQLKTVHASTTAKGLQVTLEDITCPQQVGPLRGPLRWSSSPGPGQHDLFFSDDRGLNQLTIERTPSEQTRLRNLLPSDGTWTSFTNLDLAVSSEGSDIAILTPDHFPSNQSDASLEVRLAGPEAYARPRTAGKLPEAEAKFRSGYIGLDCQLSTFVHGQTTSPMKDIVAHVVVFHPNDSLEYTIPAKEESFLVLCNDGLASLSGGSTASVVSTPLSMEALQYSFICERGSPDKAAWIRDVLDHVFVSDPPDEDGQRHLLDEHSSLSEAALWLRERLLSSAEAREALSNVVVNLPQSAPPDLKFIRYIAENIAMLQSYIRDTSAIGSRIVAIYDTILKTIALREQNGTTAVAQMAPPESCAMCQGSIAFESLLWARCSNRHRFGRCGTTFLALQHSGKAKSCGMCRRQYLNEQALDDVSLSEQHHERNEPQQGVSKTARLSEPLLRVLLTACNVCVYCGGKFV